MFDVLESGSCPDGMMSNPDDTGPTSVPLERLEAQICELAGHLAAATCRFLVLLGDFDARRGWASWEMTSCAAWLSWKCQMSSGTAREHVRVARALRDLPVIRGEFGAGRLSYAKVRALTRIATADTEAGLAEIAGPMTGNQLERFARAHRQVSTADDATARIRRRLAWRLEDDGSLAGTFRLPPLQGAVLLKALRAAAGELEHPHRSDAEHGPAAQEAGVSGTPAAAQPEPPTSSSLADALLIIAEAFLAGKVAAADDPDVYQVIVHVGTEAITPASPASGPAGEAADVSAETSAAVPGDLAYPADPARCHVEDGPAISVTTAQMIACSSSWTWMLHDSAGKLLDLAGDGAGPTRRCGGRPANGTSAGAGSRAVSTGAGSSQHHMPVLVPNGGTGRRSGRPGKPVIGTAAPAGSRPRPTGFAAARRRHQLHGSTGRRHDDPGQPAAGAGRGGPSGMLARRGHHHPGTIIPPWYGERLDLDYAIYTCFANAANQARQHRPRGRSRTRAARRTRWPAGGGGGPGATATRS